MNLNKRQFIKNRKIKAKTVGQSAADLFIRTIIRDHFRLFVLVQVCLVLCAAMPTTSNGGQALSDNVTAERDTTFPAAGRWNPPGTLTGSLNVARQLHSATLLPDGRVLVAGGFSNGFIIGSVELYDPATGTWTFGNSLSIERFTHTATLLSNGKVLVAGGFGGSGTLASSELYDPMTGTWAATGNLNTPRVTHAAA